LSRFGCGWRINLALAQNAIPAARRDVLPQGRSPELFFLKPALRQYALRLFQAADDHKTHELLGAQHIKPLIQNRALWKNQTEEMLPGHDGKTNVVHDEAGTLYCYDQASAVPVKHKLAL
jgi:hypothetical protein